MSGFKPFDNDDFDRVFMTTTELVDNFVGEELWGCGYNFYGELGDNTTSARSTLVRVITGETNWKQVSCGRHHSLMVKTDGTLWGSGDNNYKAIGNSGYVTTSSPVQNSGGGTNWKQVSASFTLSNSAGIKTDGTLWAWGSNGYGELGDNTLVSKASPVTTAGGGTNWKQVSTGHESTAAIKTDGTLWTWGRDHYGQLGHNTTSVNTSSPVTISGGGTNWKQVSCGKDHMAAIKTDGTLWVWGNSLNGELGDGTSSNRSSPVTTIGGGTNWKQVACGRGHTAAIKTDGTLWTWGGFGLYGTRGDLNPAYYTSSPGTVAGGGTNWKQVACGYYFDGAIKTDGTIWVWGFNEKGQLGQNNTSNYSSPVTISITSTTKWKQVSCGFKHIAAIGY